MLAEAFVLVEEKYGRGQGQVPSWTIFLILVEVIEIRVNLSIDLYTISILRNTYYMFGYIFCDIFTLVAHACVLV
jgi:hypothetical protein